MADYDSDSSEQEFTETNVLLGYATKDADEDTISRLGGQPDWLNPEQPASAALARCKVCNDLMVLLLQLNGELPERFPGHERRLFVFACRRSTCRRKQGSIRAMRGVRISKDAPAVGAKKADTRPPKKTVEEAPKQNDGPGLGSALFGGGGGGGSGTTNPFASNANPFSTGTSSSSPFNTAAPASNPFSKPAAEPEQPEQQQNETKDPAESLPKTFAETLSLNNPQTPSGPPTPPEPWPAADALPKPYPLSYLADAEFETLDPEPMPVPQNARMEVDNEGGAGAAGGDTKDVFESSMDAVFQKFADRMAQNPEQAIRYEFAGTPLLYSKADAVGKALGGGGRMPRCGNCGAGRVFEVQMTPHAITELEAEELSLEGMDWGTIIVGVCEADCQQRGVEPGDAGYLEEWCGVQWEEIEKR